MITLPDEITEAVRSEIRKMRKGDCLPLSKLAGMSWNSYEIQDQRNFGKPFRVMVNQGQFPGLVEDRKRPPNTWYYRKV